MCVLKKERKGFTILELLAAVVIVGIIITLAVIAINRYVIQGHNTIDNQLEKQLVLATKNYYSDNKKTFIVDKNESSVVWYATLKSNNYIINDLEDSNGNLCSKSFVLMKRKNSKIVYTGCVMCDNDGYNNLNKNKECKESINNDLKCTFTRSGSSKLGIVKQNTDVLKLDCVGKKEMVLTNNSKTITKDTFSISNGVIESIENGTIEKDSTKNQYKLSANINIGTKSDGNLIIVFNDGNNKVGYKDSNGNVKEHSPLILTIPVDGKGPLCKLSGPYKDSKLTIPITGVKSKSTVYYGLVCKDDNDIKNIGSISNDTIKDGFGTDIEGVSSLKITDLNKKGNNAISALVNVTVEVPDTNKKTFNLNLKFAENAIQDNLDNGNNEAGSEIDGKSTTLVIDDQAPTCVFSGPSSDIDFRLSKIKLNIKDSSDFVYYSLKCTDENDINNSFNINQITNNGFGRIVLEKTNRIKINGVSYGYEYIIKAYSSSSEGTGYLSYNVSNTSDMVGNVGLNHVINSGSVRMIDYTKIPKCNITTNYASDYRSATLTGYMSDSKGLSGYAWSSDSGEVSKYNSISGSSNSVSYKISNNGYYYLHMKNVNDLTGYCLAYVSLIKEAPPEAPVLTASDGITSGNWHNSNYTLTASGSGSYAIYYYGTNASSLTYTTPMNVMNETNGTTYYAKACSYKDRTNCSDVVSYNALLDKTKPTCTLSGSKSSGGTYSSGYWTMYDVTMRLSSSDSRSGVDSSKTTLTNPFSKKSYNSYFTTSVSSNSLGIGTVTATCTDKAGNVNTDSFSLKIDKQKPTVSLSPKGKKLSGATTISLSCSDGSGSGVDSKSMTAPNGNTYNSNFTISKDGGSVTATCTDNVGNTSSVTEKYLPQCTWTSWKVTSTEYNTSCSSSTSDTKKVSCDSGYKKKVVYSGSPNYSYSFSKKSDILMVSGTGSGKTSKQHCASKISIVTTCSASNVGKYQYVSASKKSGDTYCTVKKCEKSSNGYSDYKAGSPIYGKTCSASGTKGKTVSYSVCTSGYYKVDTSTRSCK